MPEKNDGEEKVPGTSIPRDVSLDGFAEDEAPREESQKFSEEDWKVVNLKILTRARELEVAYRDRIQDHKPTQEEFAIEAAALATAAGHIGALAGMPHRALFEMIEVSYQEAAMVILERMLGR